MSIYGPSEYKITFYHVLTQSRELTNYCQESVRPTHGRKYAEALNNINIPGAMELIVSCIKADSESYCALDDIEISISER